MIARGRVRRAHRDRGANILELEVIGLGAVMEDADLVLGIAGVARLLGARFRCPARSPG